MKYNSTYVPKISLKDTVLFTDDVRKLILTHFSQKFDLINIMTPQYFLEEDPMLLKLDEVTRNVTFDMGKEYKVGAYTLSDSPYLRDMIRKLKLTPKEALISENTFIWRDLDETPVLTPERHEMTIQFLANDEPGLTKKIAREIYTLIFEKALSYEQTLKIKNIFPEFLPVISAQSLENEYPDRPPKAREIEFILEQDAFLLKNPGARLLTGHFHTNLPPMIYDLDDFCQIILKDRINSFVLKTVSVAKLAMGKKLSEQLNTFGLNDLKQHQMYASLIEDERTIIEVKINLPRIMMALLGKGHISEVQPGGNSSEVKSIKTRYKIQTY